MPTVLVPRPGGGQPSTPAHGFGALPWCWPAFSASQQFRCVVVVLASLQRLAVASVPCLGAVLPSAHPNSFGVTHAHGPSSSALRWFQCLALVLAILQRLAVVPV